VNIPRSLFRFSLLALALWSPLTSAATRLCLQVRAEDDQESFEKLVRDELGRHPSHLVVDDDCQIRLLVELFDLKGVHYLTCRLDQQVPLRFTIKDLDDLSRQVSTAIAETLAHDPVQLATDITRYSAIQRAAHSVLKRGHNFWRFELYQGIGYGENNATFAPGGSIAIHRGADHWQIYTRIYFGGYPGRVYDNERILRIQTGADIGLSYEFNALSSFSFYASTGVGLQYMRFEGRLDPSDINSLENRNDFGPTFHTRLGARFLRIYDFDCDIFVHGYLPMFRGNRDSLLERFYAPSVQIGLGVGF